MVISKRKKLRLKLINDSMLMSEREKLRQWQGSTSLLTTERKRPAKATKLCIHYSIIYYICGNYVHTQWYVHVHVYNTVPE